jgi:membrane protein YqaA with SNARE-associated domain
MGNIKNKAKSAAKGLHFHTFGLVRRLYDWTLSWANTKYGMLALFVLAFIESSFFPIPPDILLIALCISLPSRSFFLALIASIGSVLGGMFGYYIGLAFYDTIGLWIIQTLHYEHYFQLVKGLYEANAFLSILTAAFTPIPYKVFTIAAGFFRIDFWTMVFASVIGRSARFFIVATLLFFYGERIKTFIDKYFNLLTIIFLALLIGGFLAIKYLV